MQINHERDLDIEGIRIFETKQRNESAYNQVGIFEGKMVFIKHRIYHSPDNWSDTGHAGEVSLPFLRIMSVQAEQECSLLISL